MTEEKRRESIRFKTNEFKARKEKRTPEWRKRDAEHEFNKKMENKDKFEHGEWITEKGVKPIVKQLMEVKTCKNVNAFACLDDSSSEEEYVLPKKICWAEEMED